MRKEKRRQNKTENINDERKKKPKTKKRFQAAGTKQNKRLRQKGRGILNWVISKLPIELHVPGYNYCGPGTRLKSRLARGDQGVNRLDDACKQHDIAYSRSTDLAHRNHADRVLRDRARQIAESAQGLGEKLMSKVVANVMDVKQKNGW